MKVFEGLKVFKGIDLRWVNGPFLRAGLNVFEGVEGFLKVLKVIEGLKVFEYIDLRWVNGPFLRAGLKVLQVSLYPSPSGVCSTSVSH